VSAVLKETVAYGSHCLLMRDLSCVLVTEGAHQGKGRLFVYTTGKRSVNTKVETRTCVYSGA
jgi:hypothetical protein